MKTTDNEKEHAKMWFKELKTESEQLQKILFRRQRAKIFEWTDMYADLQKLPKKRLYRIG